MKITAVKSFVVDGGYRPWTFAKIETDVPGLVGWGDGSDWHSPDVVAAGIDFYGSWIIGRDPMQIEGIFWDLVNRTRHDGGAAWKAMAGIDSALWDIKGKALNAPVWQLLGGKMRDRIPLYWSHCGTTRANHPRAERLCVPPVKTREDLRAVAHEAREMGFTAIKTAPSYRLDDVPETHGDMGITHSGELSPALRRSAETIVSIFREALGPDIGIAVDVSWYLKLGGAAKLAQALEPYDLMWLETETWDADAQAAVQSSTRTPICHGESLYGLHQFKPFLQLHAQHVIMPDLAFNGITMGKKIADFAHAYDTSFSPHNCHSPLTTLVAAHVCATIPNFKILEIDVDDAPWRDDIMTHPFTIENGSLVLPDRPGLGSDLIESELVKHKGNVRL